MLILNGNGDIDPSDIKLFIKQWHLRNEKRLESEHSDCLSGTRTDEQKKSTA